MIDFSVATAQIVEAVTNAAWDISHPEERPPTPFQRAVIGGLVILGDAIQSQAVASLEAAGYKMADAPHYSSQQVGAAYRAVAPFLDETPRPA
jgi:hypothetical protein